MMRQFFSLAEYCLRGLREPRGLAKLMLCGLLLLVTGCQTPNLCGIPDLCGPEPGPNLPNDFNGVSTPDSSANLGIDDFFSDPVLTQLICQGLATNQELKIMNQEIQIAGNEILARRGAYLPFLFFRGSGGFDRTSKFTPLGAAEEQLTAPEGRSFPDPLPNVRFSVDMLWRIDIWREFRNARDAAMQRYCEAIERRNFFVTKLVAEIAENYFELAALDKRLQFLNQTIEIQEQSLEVAKAQKMFARGTELGVQRFLAEVRKNESQRFIVRQQIIEAENRINFLVGRYPQAVDRVGWDFITLDSRALCVGIPPQLLQNRRDIRAAEREIAAAGLDVAVARAHFFPSLDLTAGLGFEAFNPRFLFDPEAFIANAAGELVAPLINKRAIQAEYLSANARQLQAIYDYQRTVLNAFTEVVNSIAKVENYRRSVEIKASEVQALDLSVSIATDLFQNARAEFSDVLFSQRDLLEARTALIEAKQQQLAAIVNAYQALGGGYLLSSSGKGFAELYCPPELQPEDVRLPTISNDLTPPAGPGKATLSPSPMNPSPMPPPQDPGLQPAPAEPGVSPAFRNATPMSGFADERLPYGLDDSDYPGAFPLQ